jgi:hypothetical protein
MSDNPIGEPAGKPGLHGYLWIEIDGVNYTAQDLAWMCTHGSLPDGVIVHLNGDRTDNRMENLHLVTGRSNINRPEGDAGRDRDD